jgi:Fur family transcriptional regulator, peroxide stress response regulator
MNITSPVDNFLIEQLREKRLRLTPQRLAIYRALVTTDAHPTAQTLFEQLQPTLPSLSQATVYNTLQALVTHGLIQQIGTAGDDAVHYDGNPTPHINLICTRCHRIEDLCDVSMAEIMQRVVSASGYKVQGMRVAYYGLCNSCQSELAQEHE